MQRKIKAKEKRQKRKRITENGHIYLAHIIPNGRI